jgi:cytochrome c peroxidase
MGKASCGTCHFAPSFFGSIPPHYLETEFENLGVPVSANLDKTQLDTDLGQYELYKIHERKGFFKTSTVRNIAKTAPYMHNGVFETLEEVIEFYDRGGGLGIGLDNPNQTLPESELGLSDSEKSDLIAFLHSLTDQELVEKSIL